MNANSDDPFGLERFVEAQKDCYHRALAELNRGRKDSHWMWFVFPQFVGLGRSEIAQFYAIQSAGEVKAFLHHPVLGMRIMECCDALLRLENKTASEIFGFPDDLKLKSSITLFSTVADPGSVFSQVLAKYFQGNPDQRTLELLERGV